MHHWPEIIRTSIEEQIASFSNAEFLAFQKGINFAHTAGVFAPGTFGSDVLVGIAKFQEQVARAKRDKEAPDA